MNKLNNVNRDGGYPIVSETLDVLNSSNQVLLDFFDGLNLPSKVIVFIKTNRSNDFVSVSTVYVRQDSARGKICKTNFSYEAGGFDTLKLLAQISETNHDFSDGVNVYGDVYTTYEAAIATTSDIYKYRLFRSINDAISYSINGDPSQWQLVGTPVAPFYEGYTDGDEGLFYKKMLDGKVRLRGSCVLDNWSQGYNGYLIFKLPVFYRPISEQYFTAPNGLTGVNCVKINTNGDVEILMAGFLEAQTPPNVLHLDSIEFVTR